MFRLGEGYFAECIHDRNGYGLGLDARNADEVVVELDRCFCNLDVSQSFGTIIGNCE